MAALLPYFIAAPFGLAAMGYFFDKTGEGVESASNGAIKLAAAAGVGYFVAKKANLI